MKGPVLQNELIDILILFSTHKIAFVGDTKKMYRNVFIHPDDQSFQTILWRKCESEPVQKLILNAVTYGTKPGFMFGNLRYIR